MRDFKRAVRWTTDGALFLLIALAWVGNSYPDLLPLLMIGAGSVVFATGYICFYFLPNKYSADVDCQDDLPHPSLVTDADEATSVVSAGVVDSIGRSSNWAAISEAVWEQEEVLRSLAEVREKIDSAEKSWKRLYSAGRLRPAWSPKGNTDQQLNVIITPVKWHNPLSHGQYWAGSSDFQIEGESHTFEGGKSMPRNVKQFTD